MNNNAIVTGVPLSHLAVLTALSYPNLLRRLGKLPELKSRMVKCGTAFLVPVDALPAFVAALTTKSGK